MAIVQQQQPVPRSSPRRRRRRFDAGSQAAPPPVCRYWKSGCCNRNPCRFLHTYAEAGPTPVLKKRSTTWVNSSCATRTGPGADGVAAMVPPVPAEISTTKRQADARAGPPPPPAKRSRQEPAGAPAAAAPVVVKNRNTTWLNPSCVAKIEPGVDGEAATIPPVPVARTTTKREADERAGPPPPAKCIRQEPAEAPWCVGDGFCGVARLKGHTKAVTGVVLPEGSDKLFSGSMDGTVRTWDCHTGQCVNVAMLHEEGVRGLVAMGPWVLAGVRGAVKAVHTRIGMELSLRAPATQNITAMLCNDDEHLFVGTEDGAVYMWRLSQEHHRFDEVAALTGQYAVTALTRAKIGVYSGSADGGISVWDLKTHRCIYSFAAHASKVTALLCWDQFLLSSSDDGTVKVWRSPEPDQGDEVDFELELHYTHKEEGELMVAMDGTYDADKKPVLLVSRSDGVVRVYDLPSLKTRGQIRFNGEVRAISLRTPDIFFTGDESGEVRVVKWTASASPEAKD